MKKSLQGYSFPDNYSIDSKEDVYNFLLNIYIDSSQQLFIERNFKYYFPLIYKDFLTYTFPDTFKFTQKLWHYFNNDFECKLGYCLCEGCNKRTRFDGFRFGYRSFCSTSCGNKSEYHKDTIKKTCIEKYGVEYITQSNIMKDKSKQSFLNKYGDCCMFKTNHFKDLSKETCLEKYGKEHFVQTDEYLKKSKKTCLEKYGVEHQLKNKEIVNRVFASKKKNHTTTSSKIEKQLKEYLELNNINFTYQYNKDPRYPFACDFYLNDFDLFIEIQGYWTHGPKPFNKADEDCMNLLNKWIKLSPNHCLYSHAIKNWTQIDVIKRTLAKNNNLNYLEIFSIDLNTCVKEILIKIKELEN